MYTIERANEYILARDNKVKDDYRYRFHAMAAIGWINDPNGFIYYKGEYHLFYQYYPYEAIWGPMHWGHAKSKDLISWDTMPVALAPDQPYDQSGCFSGTAIEKDGKMYLMYTGYTEGETAEKNRQVQCIAVSEDGIHFEKSKQNPVLKEIDLPRDAIPQDFRDPKVIHKGEYFYSLIGSKAKDGVGQILLYKSKNLLDWEFVSVMLKGNRNEGSMWECPDLFELNGKDILILSVEGLPSNNYNFPNTHSVLSIIGVMDWENGIFHKEIVEEIDYGLDFYAPQTLLDDKGRRIMISWMQMWGRNIPSDTEGHGWAGAMTLPRELIIKNNHIYQKAVPEIKDYFTNHKSLENMKLIDETKQFEELSVEVGVLAFKVHTTTGNRFTVEFRANEKERTLLTYDYNTRLLELNRKQSGIELIGKETEHVYKRNVILNRESEELKLEIYLDKSSVEVFINDGEYTMTSTIYPMNKAKQVKIHAEGEIFFSQMEKWDIEV